MTTIRPPIRPYDPDIAERVVAQGRGGLSRAEIASALGVSLTDFEAWAAQHPAFAAALADADTEARAWWEAQPRIAFETGATFRGAAWAKVMAQRYGRSSDRPRQETREQKARGRVTARLDIPDNGRRRRPIRGSGGES
jgi:ABC-type nitrate/sulfonate/bicarbonate transport system substrate-binding protein